MSNVFIFILVIWNIVLTAAVIKAANDVDDINGWIADNLPRFRRMYQDLLVREISEDINSE